MPQPRLSRSRQSNPSILTAAGNGPKLVVVRKNPPLLAPDGEVDEPDDRNGSGVNGVLAFSSRNRASWIKGLADLVGGDP